MDFQILLDKELIHLNIYTGLLLVSMGGVFYKSLHKRHHKLTDSLLDNLEKQLPTFAHILAHEFFFRRRYAKTIYSEHQGFNVSGLRSIGTFTLALEQAFMQLQLSNKANPQQLNSDLIKAFGPGKHQIWDFLHFGQCNVWDFLRFDHCGWRELTGQGVCQWRDILNFKPRTVKQLPLVIIGAPGSGKTTLLQHVALTLALHKQCRYGLANKVPLLLFLRQHIPLMTQDNPLDLAAVAQDFFGNEQCYPHLKPPTGWFKRQLLAGHCVVLLDGLDEVVETQQRQLVSRWVMQQKSLYPKSIFVVTSRPHGYQSASLAQAHVLEVQPFTPTQIKQFVENWYLANELASLSGCMDSSVHSRATQGGKNLLQQMHQCPHLNTLTNNPLLLTLIAMIHRHQGQLPARRVELYSEICDVLLRDWRSARGTQETLTAAQKRTVLQPLAKYMMQNQRHEISFAEAMAVIHPALQALGIMETHASHFLHAVQASSGLLLESATGVWRFTHLTFQEYFAACELTHSKMSQTHWKPWVEESWWQETIQFYAEQADATHLVRACLQCRSVPSLTLAATCLQEALKLDTQVQVELEQALEANLESEQPELRRLAAEVKLKQRLQNLQRLDEQKAIDLDPLSCAEYQLFLDELREQDKCYQPDHWLDRQYPHGQAEHAVLGMRYQDAQQFCEWLNAKQGNEMSRYRLPHTNEVEDTEHYGCWLQDGSVLGEAKFLQHFATTLQNAAKHLFAIPYPRARAQIRVLDLSRVRVLALDLARARTLARDLALDLDLVLDLDLAFSSDPTLARTLARDLDLARVRTLDLARAFARARDLARDLVRDLTHSSTPERLAKLPEDLSLDLAEEEMLIQRKAQLLNSLLGVLQTESEHILRQIWHSYTILLTGYIWLGCGGLEKHPHKWWQLWRYSEHPVKKAAIQQLNWHLKITQLREQGELPAWEAIRIVRERRDSELLGED